MNPPENQDQSHLPATEVEITRTAEQIFSIREPLEGECSRFPDPLPADPSEVYDAILVLARSLSTSRERVTEGSPGDVFLAYQIALRVHGDLPMVIEGVMPMHGILTPEGIDTAPDEVMIALSRIGMPFKNRLLKFLNVVSEDDRTYTNNRLGNR